VEELALAVPGVLNVDNQIQLAKTNLSGTIEPDIRAEIEQEPINTQLTALIKQNYPKQILALFLAALFPMKIVVIR
jgi:hypothetical protein